MDGCSRRARAAGRRRPLRREDLQAAEGRAELALVADADHHRSAVRRRGRHQAEGHDLGVLLGPDRGGAIARGPAAAVADVAGRREPDSVGTRDPDTADARGRTDRRQHVLVRVEPGSRSTEPLRAVLPRRQVRVDSPLDVHVLPLGEPLGHRHDGGQLAAEMAGDPLRELGGPGVFGQRPGPELEQQAQPARQPPEIRDIRGRRLIGGAHPVNNARVREGCQGVIATPHSAADLTLCPSPN
jgi:hypothetical protein